MRGRKGEKRLPAKRGSWVNYGVISLWVLLVLLAINSASVTSQSIDSQNVGGNNTTAAHSTSEIVEDELIVMFKRYMSSDEQKKVLQSILSKFLGMWEIVDRNNPASVLPSDFALIRLLNHKDQIKDVLERNKEVKHTVPQKKFVNTLKSFEEVEKEEEEDQPVKFNLRSMKYRNHAPFSSEEDSIYSEMKGKRRLHSSTIQVPHLFNADYLWDKMYTGTGIRVAVFDTGLGVNDARFRRVVDRTNWTNEKTLDDGLGHGTFVTGVIASQDEQCLGFAPDADIFVFRVFTNQKVSYTSWFLDAFNYAIHSRIHVLNLSIGGPDFMDVPFVEKVWEMSANNIIVVSAIGNDGPLYGTLNNPADQLDVIGVGGVDFSDNIAAFSSRGMTTWELPLGYGRIKPDIVAYGQSVSGSRVGSGCRTLSGTSVASPVVAGAITLLLSTIPESKREMINPASMKQALVESAELIPNANVFEQGFGKFNLLRAYEILSEYKPRASALPASLDLTQCPYMWPYCEQPLYYSGIPTIVNITILNGMGVSGKISALPQWISISNGEHIEMAFSYPEVLWPWTGYLGIHMRVTPEAENFTGIVEGIIKFEVTSPPALGEKEKQVSVIEIPVKIEIIPTPPRNKRILWDQFHNLRYPSGYFPRDVLAVRNEPFDWNGDHIHTNFRDLFTYLRSNGFFVEVLGEPFTCFNSSNYGILFIADPEDEFFKEEIQKIQQDVKDNGLSVMVFADWYNVDVMKKIKFFDENTKQLWTPATGGANIPALNDLLGGFGVEFGDRVYEGEFDTKTLQSISPDPNTAATFASGASISKFPAGGVLVSLELNDQSLELVHGKQKKANVPVLGLLRLRNNDKKEAKPGRIAIFGDSSCIDNANKQPTCFSVVEKMLAFASDGSVDEAISSQGFVTELPYTSELRPAERLDDSDLIKFSKVLNKTLPVCYIRSRLRFEKAVPPEDPSMTITWPEMVYVSTGDNNFNGLPNGMAPNGLNKDISTGFGGYVIPYALLLLGVIFVIIIALKRRATDTSNKGIQV